MVQRFFARKQSVRIKLGYSNAEERSPVDGGSDNIRGVLLSAYFCAPL
jgi:hypothetical protein